MVSCLATGPARAAGLIAALAVSGLLAGTGEAATRVSVERLEGGEVRVRYRLQAPLQELQFRLHSDVRTSRWRAEEGFELGSGALRAADGMPFDDVTLTLMPDEGLDDPASPALVTVDETVSVVNLDHVLPRNAPGRVRVSVWEAYDPFTVTCVDLYEAPVDAVTGDAAGRYVLLGTTDAECRARVGAAPEHVVFGEGAPPALVDTVANTFDAAYARLADAFGMEITPEPAVILAHAEDAEPAGVQARSGWRSTVLVRHHGPPPASAESAALEIRRAVVHELAHLWIGGPVTVEAAAGAPPAWLTEGAAEYLALLELERTGVLTRQALSERLGQSATGCARGLDRPLLGEAWAADDELVRDCGVLVQLVYDALARLDASEPRTVVDLWRNVLETSGGHGRPVEPAQFLDLQPRARAALAGFLDGPSADAEALAAALADAGADVRYEASSGALGFGRLAFLGD